MALPLKLALVTGSRSIREVTDLSTAKLIAFYGRRSDAGGGHFIEMRGAYEGGGVFTTPPGPVPATTAIMELRTTLTTILRLSMRGIGPGFAAAFFGVHPKDRW